MAIDSRYKLKTGEEVAYFPPIQNTDNPYLTEAAMHADQANQLEGYGYLVTGVGAFTYLGTVAGTAADYEGFGGVDTTNLAKLDQSNFFSKQQEIVGDAGVELNSLLRFQNGDTTLDIRNNNNRKYAQVQLHPSPFNYPIRIIAQDAGAFPRFIISANGREYLKIDVDAGEMFVYGLGEIPGTDKINIFSKSQQIVSSDAISLDTSLISQSINSMLKIENFNANYFAQIEIGGNYSKPLRIIADCSKDAFFSDFVIACYGMEYFRVSGHTSIFDFKSKTLKGISGIDLSGLGQHANDAAASSAGVAIGFAYINSSTGAMHRRLT